MYVASYKRSPCFPRSEYFFTHLPRWEIERNLGSAAWDLKVDGDTKDEDACACPAH